MSKLVALLMTAAFAFTSAGAFAMSHGGGAKDETKMEEAGEMKDGMKHEMSDEMMDQCKDLQDEAKDECEKMMEEDEAMKGEKKAE